MYTYVLTLFLPHDLGIGRAEAASWTYMHPFFASVSSCRTCIRCTTVWKLRQQAAAYCEQNKQNNGNLSKS